MQMDNEIPENAKRRTFMVFMTLKKFKLLKKTDAHVHTTSVLNDISIPVILAFDLINYHLIKILSS